MDLYCPKCHTKFSIDPGQFEKKPEPKKKSRWTFKRIVKLFLSVAILYAIGYFVFNSNLLENQGIKTNQNQAIIQENQSDEPGIIYLTE